MRWKNLKIAHKLNLTFSVFIVIFVLFGTLAILQLKQIQNYASAISNEDIPLSKKITELERNWQQAIFYLRSYGYNKNKQFLYDGLTHLQFTQDNLNEIKQESIQDQSMLSQLNVLDKELHSFETNVKEAQTAIDNQIVTNLKLDSCYQRIKNSKDFQSSMLIRKLQETNVLIHDNSKDPQIVAQELDKSIKYYASARDMRNIPVLKNYTNLLNELSIEINASLNLVNDQMDNGILLTQLLSQMIFEKTQMGVNSNINLANNSIYVLIGGLITFLIIGLIGIKYLTRTFTSPIYKLVKFADYQANGKLNNDMDLNQGDEIGQLAESIRTSNNKIKEMVIGLFDTSNKMTEIGNSFNYKASLLHTHSSSQAASSEELSASMEEMNTLISQNATDSLHIISVSNDSSKKLSKELDNTKKAMQIMDELIGKSENIREIARQTSILSLNASIEAAKAGQFGKGFGVIANSIRELAEKATDVSNEMNKTSSQGKIYSNLAGDSLKRFHEENAQTSSFIHKMSDSALEQQNESTQITNAVGEFNTYTQQIALMADELNHDSELIKKVSQQMNNLLTFFDIKERTIIKNQETNKKTNSYNEINKMLGKLNIPGITLSKSDINDNADRKVKGKKVKV